MALSTNYFDSGPEPLRPAVTFLQDKLFPSHGQLLARNDFVSSPAGLGSADIAVAGNVPLATGYCDYVLLYIEKDGLPLKKQAKSLES